ncbi:T9SS type A sorting domain-containing protein, partial [Bacteroidales bacterium OttesenSCG-928-I21]|nr:T9SS type A sorting domain-containing protein [Bacteroidales bacterium OttesenSCG-928-I21]
GNITITNLSTGEQILNLAGNSSQFTYQYSFEFCVDGIACPNNIMVGLYESEFLLTGAYPTDGVYSGTGVENGYFDPLEAGIGTHEITYEYEDISCSFYITVFDNITCPDDMEVLISDEAFLLTGETPEGGYYSGPGVSNEYFDPALAGVGAHVITYTYNLSECNFTITVSNPNVGISVIDDIEVKIYPNPTSGIVKIETNGNVDIEIVNLMGQTVKKINSTAGLLQVDMSNYPNGIYVVRIITNEKIKTKKVEKITN